MGCRSLGLSALRSDSSWRGNMSGLAVWREDGGMLQEEAQEEVRPSRAWPEERCEELWDRVEGVRHKLTRILHPAKLTPYLRQCKVIDEQDEDEVLNSTQYPLRISKAGRLLDILRGQGQRGLQAFMESLEFYHPEQYTQLTGEQPTQRCSLILDEEGPEGLTQFLLLEVRKLREQLRSSRVCERRLSQRCRVAEDERNRAEHKVHDLRHARLQLERLRQDWESASRELGKLKDRHLEQAVKYSRALEEQSKASGRERALLSQVEELKLRLTKAEDQTADSPKNTKATQPLSGGATQPLSGGATQPLSGGATQPLSGGATQPLSGGATQPLSGGATGSPAASEERLRCPEVHVEERSAAVANTSSPPSDVIALMDILQQDRREAAEQRQELCNIITRLQGEQQSMEEQRDKVEAQCEQLQLRVRTLQLDWDTEQKRSVSYFTQIMELEKERDQALRSRDGLQLEYTDCLLDKNRLRKRVAELHADVEQQQRELEKERERSRERPEQSAPCLHCSHLSLCSEDQCFGPCCSLGWDLSPTPTSTHPVLRKTSSRGPATEHSEDSCFNSEENLLLLTENDEKEINRLSTFPFPPCMSSIHRRFNTEFDLDSWGSDENENIAGEQCEASLSDSWTSLHSHFFPPDLVNLPAASSQQPRPPVPEIASRSPSSSPPPSPRHGRASLAEDVTIVGGNRTGIFVSHVEPGSPAEQCGLKEGSELLELERVLFGGGSVLLSQCTAEVAHFSLQWWTEPSVLKHQSNTEAYSRLCSQLSLPAFEGADSFYVRVNLSLEPKGDPPSLGVSCDDILYVTDTRYKGKYQWRCSLVNLNTAKPLQAGTMPNYNRAQQLLLVKLRKMSLAQKDFKKKMFSKKTPSRVRLVKAVDPSYRGIGTSQPVIYTLSKRHEEHLIPYSLVHPVQVHTKRPVIFSPSLLSCRLIERLLQPAESGLKFNTCRPEPILPSEKQDRKIFWLDSFSPEQAVGIRLQSIQDVISQDKHCLLELGLHSVEGLLKQGIYPIVIHIRPKNKKHKKLRKFFPRCGEHSVMEEVCHAEELQLETLPLLHFTLEPNIWSCTDELLAALRSAIHSQQRALAWVELDRLQ